jgi:hypothetical protein
MRSLLLIPIIAASAAAQQVPTRALTKPEVEYTEPFSQLNSVFELRDGRVVAADTKDKTLQAIDLRTGTSTPIGREGAGPHEWGLPLGIYRWHADSVLVNDAVNARYLILGPDAKPVRTYNPLADALTSADGRGARGGDAARGDGGRGGARGDGAGRQGPGGGRGIRLGGSIPLRGTDAMGRIYSQDPAISFNPDGTITSADSAPIVRFDPAANKRDTVAYINLAKNAVSGAARGAANSQTFSIRIGGGTPFAPADDWTVLRDGSVAIVRVSDYHVEIVPPAGRRIVGRPVAFTPVRVTEADKEQWREAQKNGTRIVRSIGDGGRGGAAPQLPPVQEPAAWPATKPPFIGSATYAAPNGDIWVVRARSAQDKIPSADVFNGQGQLIGRVTLPEKTRLLAFGAKSVYLARVDDDDLQYLQRHAMQWTGCPASMKESCGGN